MNVQHLENFLEEQNKNKKLQTLFYTDIYIF